MTRSQSSVRQRSQFIRKRKPNLLEEHFEMQNRICDLCGHPIQDLILAVLDHSTPVIHFARGPLPTAEAARQANDPTNLRAVHFSCNGSKGDLSRREWFERGLNKKMGEPRIWTDGELLNLQFQFNARTNTCARRAQLKRLHQKMRERGFYNKLAQNPKRLAALAVKTKDPEWLANVAAANKKTTSSPEWLAQHERMIESPEWQKANMAGRKKMQQNPHWREAMKNLPQNPEWLASIRAAGKRRSQDPKWRAANKAAMAKKAQNPKWRAEHAARLRARNHENWHVSRNIVNPQCSLCMERVAA